MKLLDLVQQRKELGVCMSWDTLYCCDLQITQDALRDGLLSDMLQLAVPEVGSIAHGKLLMERAGATQLQILAVNHKEGLAHFMVTRRYMVLPVFTVHVASASTRAVEELEQWLGDYVLLRGGAARFGFYYALVSGGARTTIDAWKAHHPHAEVRVDDRLENYANVITHQQALAMLRAEAAVLSGS